MTSFELSCALPTWGPRLFLTKHAKTIARSPNNPDAWGTSYGITGQP